MIKGITVAGTILADKIKIIESYPKLGMLSKIILEQTAVGGCVPNVAIDLAVLDPTLTVKALGAVGQDANGEYVLSQMKSFSVDIAGVNIKDKCTGYSDVMTEKHGGQRTFFCNNGANDLFNFDELIKADTTMVHVGYALLLNALDSPDSTYGTILAKALNALQKRGIKTSLDMISDSGERYAQVVIPVLKYIDYLIVNEVEAAGICSISISQNCAQIDLTNIENIARKIMYFGVKEKVIIHCPQAGFCLSKNGKFTAMPSLMLPKGFVMGTVGAGDAFCACCLLAIYRGYADELTLKFASCGAACNLSQADSVSGMIVAEKVLELDKKYNRIKDIKLC